MCLLMSCRKPLVLRDHQKLSGFPCLVDHGRAFFDRHVHGLFTEHMLAGPQCQNSVMRMHRVSRAYADCVQVHCNHLFHAAAYYTAILLLHFFRFASRAVIERGNLYIFICCVFRQMSSHRDGSASDHADSEFLFVIHLCPPFFCLRSGCFGWFCPKSSSLVFYMPESLCCAPYVLFFIIFVAIRVPAARRHNLLYTGWLLFTRP